MIGLVDYGMGNLGSIANMIRKIGGQSCIVQEPGDLKKCSKAILPGVGAFDTAVRNLHDLNLWDSLHEFALVQQKPLLGICLGMQVLCLGSEEGSLKGLGWIQAEVKKFQFDQSNKETSSLKVPHMGWNTVKPVDADFPLFTNWEKEMRFYFVHSYAVACTDKQASKGKTTYGYSFDSVIGKDNIMGIQCHPEKSHRYGMIVYKNFIDL
jgi:glutamine amidotransferase